MRPNGGWSSSGIQNMHASIGQYSMHAGEPAQPVQQSVVIARMRGFFLRVALPSPTDIGNSFSTMSKMLVSASAVMCETLTYDPASLNERICERANSRRALNKAAQSQSLLMMLL